jgi:hypothetical protein
MGDLPVGHNHPQGDEAIMHRNDDRLMIEPRA